MGRSTRITVDHARAVLRLTHELRDLRHDADAQHRRLVDGVAAMLDAHDAVAYAVRDYRRGRPARFVRMVGKAEGDDGYRRYLAELIELLPGAGGLEVDPFVDRTVDAAGRRVVATLGEVLAGRADGRADGAGGGGSSRDAVDRRLRAYPLVADLMHATGHRDGVIAIARDGAIDGSGDGAIDGSGDGGGDGLAVGITLQRFGRCRRFSARETAALDFALGEVERLLAAGVLAPLDDPRPPLPPLSPRLAEVRRRVLAGEAPKEMARAMGISVHTVREHLDRLYRRHGVSGREELTAALTRP